MNKSKYDPDPWLVYEWSGIDTKDFRIRTAEEELKAAEDKGLITPTKEKELEISYWNGERWTPFIGTV